MEINFMAILLGLWGILTEFWKRKAQESLTGSKNIYFKAG
jgi:hypothetical protein